jgi:hypothetical protein
VTEINTQARRTAVVGFVFYAITSVMFVGVFSWLTALGAIPHSGRVLDYLLGLEISFVFGMVPMFFYSATNFFRKRIGTGFWVFLVFLALVPLLTSVILEGIILVAYHPELTYLQAFGQRLQLLFSSTVIMKQYQSMMPYLLIPAGIASLSVVLAKRILKVESSS